VDYKNGMQVLPPDLLARLQEYVDGMYIYIPRKAENRLQWGRRSAGYAGMLARNQEICRKYQAGQSVAELAEEYYLEPKTIYRILSRQNKT